MAEVTKYSLEITGPALSFLYYAASFSNVSVFIFPLKQGAWKIDLRLKLGTIFKLGQSDFIN